MKSTNIFHSHQYIFRLLHLYIRQRKNKNMFTYYVKRSGFAVEKIVFGEIVLTILKKNCAEVFYSQIIKLKITQQAFHSFSLKYIIFKLF